MRKECNTSFRFIILTIATVELLVIFLSGCQVQPLAPADRASVAWERGREYGRVPPQELNENLTPQQLERMFIALEDIPLEGLWEGEDPNGVIQPAAKRTGPGSRLKARKAYLLGRNFIAQGAFAAAVPILTAALELDPNSAAINELLAKAHYNQNHYSAAESAARRALQFDNDNITALQILGSIRQEKKELARALSFYSRALHSREATSENPVTAVLHLQLARALLEMDYLAASAREYEKTYTLLHQQGRYAQADHGGFVRADGPDRAGSSSPPGDGKTVCRAGGFTAGLCNLAGEPAYADSTSLSAGDVVLPVFNRGAVQSRACSGYLL